MPKFERTIDLDASPQAVWAIVSNPALWSQWLLDGGTVVTTTVLQPGATLQWQAEGQTGVATLGRVEPERLLMFTTQVGDDQDSHTIEIEPHRGLFGLGSGSGSRVTYTLDTMMRRGPLGDLIAGGNPKDQLRVKHALDRLRDLAEQHA